MIQFHDLESRLLDTERQQGTKIINIFEKFQLRN